MKVFVYRNVIFNKSKFCYKDLFRKQFELIERLSIEYINIAKLFLLIRKSTNFVVYQYLYYHIQLKDDNHDEVIYELEKPFFILVLLEDLINHAFDIVNNFLKKTQKQNQAELVV